MSGFAVGLLLAIVLLLFYRWVERRHKILLAKIVGGLVVLAAIAIGWMVLKTKQEAEHDEQRRTSVSITFVPDTSTATNRRYRPSMFADIDTVSHVAFALCNHGSDTVESVAFYPKSFDTGRSTANDIRVGSYSSNLFDSDFILLPTACTTLTWTGRFIVRDSVAAVPTWVKVRGRR